MLMKNTENNQTETSSDLSASAGSTHPKLGNQTAFDASDFDSLVQLMRDVQEGNVSCRRAASEILAQNAEDLFL